MSSKREIAGADAALKIIKQLGYPSENSLIRMLKGESLTNCDLTEKDVERAVLIYGKPIAAINGKHTHTKLNFITPAHIPTTLV